jgi:hypothetical protein
MASDERTLEALLEEDRRFEPSAEFREQANASDPQLYERAAMSPESFWEEQGARAGLVRALGSCARVEPAKGTLVRWREAECGAQLPGPARGGAPSQQGCVDLGG